MQSVLQAAAASGMDLHAPVQAFIDGELLYLAAHPYGNYGVQVALRHCSQAQRDQMLSRLLPRCLALSASKHGSNVAELLLVLASAQQIEGVRASVFGGTPKARQTLRQVDLLPLPLTLTLTRSLTLSLTLLAFRFASR